MIEVASVAVAIQASSGLPKELRNLLLVSLPDQQIRFVISGPTGGRESADGRKLRLARTWRVGKGRTIDNEEEQVGPVKIETNQRYPVPVPAQDRAACARQLFK